MPTSLVDWLRAADDGTLAALLRLRPDLAVPPPADLTVLATRAGIRASVHRACDDLDTVTLAVLEALVVADADREPVAPAELRRLLGPDVPAAAVDRALAALRARALIWDDDDGLALVPAARDVVPRYPGGLGRPAIGAAGSSALPELLAAVDPDEQRVLDALAAGPPIGRSRAGADPQSPVGRLLARGLLLRVDADTVELPRQVGLALRGDRPLGAVSVAPPEVGARDRGVDVVDRTAGGAALEVLRRVELLVDFWSQAPPPVLRSGGLGVRELRRVAKELDADEAAAALLVELAVAADLVAETDSVGTGVGAHHPVRHLGGRRSGAALVGAGPQLAGPAPAARAGRAQGRRRAPDRCPVRRRPAAAGPARPAPGAGRAGRAAARGGSRIGRRPGRPAGLAGPAARRPAARRGGRLGARRGDGAGRRRPRRAVQPGPGAARGPGRADPGAARDRCPTPVDHVLLQADLTAVAPGPLEPGLAAELGLMADVESAGGATVYRFTETTVRRALDAGRTAAELHDLLATRSATPVPQALRYLVDDVARRHGRLRGGVAASFLRSDDEVLISEVLAHPTAGELELRRIAPTVVVSPLPLVELLDALRAAGFSPAAEDTGGAVLDLTDRGRRTAPRRRPATRVGAPPEPDAEQLAGLVSRMRAGDALARVRRGAARPPVSNGSAVEFLRAAAAERQRSGSVSSTGAGRPGRWCSSR